MDNPKNGFLLIDKPAGISSFDVVRQLRKQTGIRTYGHAGTLDPFATGLLIIAVNKYTRLLPLLDHAEKTYLATLEFGKATSTADPEGEIIVTNDKAISRVDIDTIIADVLAIESLQPPRFSAIKIDGQRAYTLARKGTEFELPAKPMNVLEFGITSFSYPVLQYFCRVSKGTYIRALSEWIAAKLGTVAYTTELRRTAIGMTRVDRAVSPCTVTAETISSLLVSIDSICPGLSTVSLESAELARLRNGNPAFNPGIDDSPVLVMDTTGNCCGIARRIDNYLHPKVNL